ncbi:hypothetical protein [Clostridium sp.]|uniref:hypothetical protein n=1 Tax=Clostridium sp. TaxID=1506 RepID=UPI00262CDA11|nr:hypothetical protein [Clostridium sp.]
MNNLNEVETYKIIKLDFSKNRAENLFINNINHKIKAELITDITFEGILKKIFCNTFLIETENGLTEMFRYEDVRSLKVIE